MLVVRGLHNQRLVLSRRSLFRFLAWADSNPILPHNDHDFSTQGLGSPTVTSHGSSRPPDATKKEPWIKPEHVVPIVVALITTLGLVTTTLITVLVRGTDASSDVAPAPAPTVTVTTVGPAVTVGPSGPTQSSTASGSPGPTLTKPAPAYLMNLDYKLPSNTQAGLSIVGGKKYPRSFTQGPCGASAGIVVKLPEGYSHFGAKVGYTDDSFYHGSDTDPSPIQAKLSWTADDDGFDSEETDWISLQLATLPTKKRAADLEATIPPTANNLLLSLTDDACNTAIVFGDPRVS